MQHQLRKTWTLLQFASVFLLCADGADMQAANATVCDEVSLVQTGLFLSRKNQKARMQENNVITQPLVVSSAEQLGPCVGTTGAPEAGVTTGTTAASTTLTYTVNILVHVAVPNKGWNQPSTTAAIPGCNGTSTQIVIIDPCMSTTSNAPCQTFTLSTSSNMNQYPAAPCQTFTMSTPSPDIINSVDSLELSPGAGASPCATPVPGVAILPPLGAYTGPEIIPPTPDPVSTLSGSPGGQSVLNSAGALANTAPERAAETPPAAAPRAAAAAPHVLAGMPAPAANLESLAPEAPEPAAPVPAAPEPPQEQPTGPHVLPGMPAPTV